MSNKFYSLTKIQKKKAVYNVIFGQRSNGKTYACLRYGLIEFIKTGKQLAYVRRWQEDIKGNRASRIFDGINTNGEVEKITKGKYKGIAYANRKFYLCNYDEKGKAIFNDVDLIGFTFCLSDFEHDKSTSYPLVGNIIFDEFLTNRMNLQDEFTLFMNVVSTIVRNRTDVQVYMLGNTVNKYSPYFQEMGLNHVSKQKQGTIEVYKYGESSLTVAVEYCAESNETNETNKRYFAFDNPKLQMITSGAWELDLFPHLPMKYKQSEILFNYFIVFDGEIYQANIVQVNDVYFTYIHSKTTEIKDPSESLIYTLDPRPERNYNTNILKPLSKIQEKVLYFFKANRVYYQNNSVGNAIQNFIKICKG